jgi:23S rRNA (pseudouridine1915-N3)-methyltransferase
MKINILSIGKFNNSCYQDLFELYKKRLRWNVLLKEFDIKNIKNFEINKIKEEEANLIFNSIKFPTKLIALDEGGQKFSSIAFAKKIENIILEGNSDITFVIGGPNGLSENLIKKSNLVLSLSSMTFPHLMARIVLIEQIYRAESIINNHPYHKD